MPGFFKTWQQLYDSKLGNTVRNVVFGNDYDLSDQEYIDKYGYTRPTNSAGILDLMSPESAAKLVKTGKEIKEAEKVARTAKETKSLKESSNLKKAISNADDVKFGKSGRVHTVAKSGSYERVDVPRVQKTVNSDANMSAELERRKQQMEAYKNAVISANNSFEIGNVELGREFLRDADRFNPYFDNIFRKNNGGIIYGKSGIHIKKANRGKFTEYCGGKVTNECIQRGKHSSNPKIRRRATFAANARRWKHSQGGVITPTWLNNMIHHED